MGGESMVDLFPVTITDQIAMRTLVTTRARLDGNWLSVWYESPNWPHDPLLIVNAQIDEPPILNTIASNTPVRKQRLVVMTIDRMVYEIKRQAGCGCGSRLKSAKLTVDKSAMPVPWPSRDTPAQGKQLTDIDAILQQHFPALAAK
jgi:hypothetical protein